MKYGMGFFMLTCAVVVSIFLPTTQCFATHNISYRWESPHVEMVYRDSVGTPIPTSYGFWALMQNLGHKKRLFESFMCSPAASSIGNRLDAEVSVFGLEGKPPGMVLKGQNVQAVVKLPFTDTRIMHALLEMSAGNSIELLDSLTGDQIRRAKQALSAFPDDGFPVFSPSGDRFAFQSWRGDTVDILITSQDGSRLTRTGGTLATYELRALGGTHSVYGLPVWSPDGQMVAYIANGKVVLSNLTRGITRSLTDCEDALTKLAWSPNGSMLSAVVSGMDDDVRYASDVLLIDPSATTAPVSLKNNLAILKRGFYPTNLSWRPDSRVLAIAVGLTGTDLGINGRYLSAEEMRNSIVYFVDVRSRDTRSIRLPGLYVDDRWSEDGNTWAIVVKSNGGYSLLHVSGDNLRMKTLTTSTEEMCILGNEGERIFYLDGNKPMLADLGEGKPIVLDNVRVENIQLPPGLYGGYIGFSEDFTTKNEGGEKIILIEDRSPQHYLIGTGDGKIFEKEWGKLIITAPGIFPEGWLSGFVKNYDLIHLDWSPKTKALIASGSQGGGLIEIFATKPGGTPTSVSRKLDSQTARALKVECKAR